MTDVAPVKKRPGRPRKKPLKKPMERKGISNIPINKENTVELIYDTPYIFKKIFTLFKSMAVQTLCFNFTKKELIISTIDHLKKSKIKVVINCSKTNHYHCNAEIKVYLNPTNMEKILQVLDKNYLSIAFVINKLQSRSCLTIIYKNDLKIDEIREVNLVIPQNIYPDEKFNDSDYPIKFKLPGKFFKKLVSDISSFTNMLNISKLKDSKLSFNYSSKDKSIKSKHIVTDGKEIDLVCNLKQNDIFSSSIQVDYLKPLSSSLLGDYVFISCHNKFDTIFKIPIDKESIIVYISTSIYSLK